MVQTGQAKLSESAVMLRGICAARIEAIPVASPERYVETSAWLGLKHAKVLAEMGNGERASLQSYRSSTSKHELSADRPPCGPEDLPLIGSLSQCYLRGHLPKNKYTAAGLPYWKILCVLL